MKTIYVIFGIMMMLVFMGWYAFIAYIPFFGSEIKYATILGCVVVTLFSTSFTIIPIAKWYRSKSPFKKKT